jgi:hypothetical protein
MVVNLFEAFSNPPSHCVFPIMLLSHGTVTLTPSASCSTLLKKPNVTQDQNTRVTENSIIHIEQSEKSANTIDWAPLYMRVSEFSITLVLWSCVTLGFFNSVSLASK